MTQKSNQAEWVDSAAAALERIRSERPLIHVITNLVTMNDVANALLAIGARAVMAHAPEEVAEITATAQALVLNLGTPTTERIEAMLRAGRAANDHAIPVVFDPVGVGASQFRAGATARLLAELRPAVIRGNASEIAYLAGSAPRTPGVDATVEEFDRSQATRTLARKNHAVVVVTGATDFASDETRTVAVENGHPSLKRISGAGDVLDALIAAAASVEPDALAAAASGLLWLGIAAEQAAARAGGIGSFGTLLFDTLGNLDAPTIRTDAKISCGG